MAEVTMKSTKQEIMDELERTRAMLDSRAAVTADIGTKAQEKAAEEKVITAAKSDVEKGIFSDEMNAKYTNLVEAISLLEQRLKEGYGVEKELQNMVTVVTASKEARIRLEEEYEAKKKEYNDLINAMNVEGRETQERLMKEDAQLRADLKQAREREEAEYKYELERSRKLEKDEHDDSMAEAKKELIAAQKEAEEIRMASEERAGEIAEMEDKVAAFPDKLAEEYQKGYTEGEKAAGKEYGYKKTMAEKEHEYELKDRDNRIARLEAEVSEKSLKIESLEAKLDSAYSQLRDLAAKTVESNGSIKVIGGTSSDNSSRK